MRTSVTSRGPIRRPVLAVVVLLLLAIALPGSSGALPAGFAEHPRIAFVARGDNPVDALAASSVAGSIGGIVVLTTNAGGLHSAAARSLQAFAPDLVVIAGDVEAVPAQAETDIQGLGFATRRAAGATRYETAEALGALIDDLGLGRPVITSPDPGNPQQIVGDVNVGGHLVADTVETFGSVDAHGTVRADDFAYTTVQTRTLGVPSEAFRPDVQHDFSTGAAGATGVTGTVILSAPIHLPDDAVVTGVDFYLRDNSGATSVDARLQRFEFSNGTYGTLTSATTSGTPGNVTVAAVPPAPEPVDNAAYAYMLTVRPTTTWDGTNATLRGVVLTYRVAGP
jgi:hypothetical protein